MINKSVKFKIVIITIVGVVGILISIYFFKDSDKTLPNYATVIGTICSLVGLTIAYVNILALKEESSRLANQVEGTLKVVNQLVVLSDVSKAIKINQEIQSYLREEKIDLAHLRFLDLKHMLLYFNTDSTLSDLTSSDSYKESFLNFNINLNSLNEFLTNPSRVFDCSHIVKELENLSTHLSLFEKTLKSI